MTKRNLFISILKILISVALVVVCVKNPFKLAAALVIIGVIHFIDYKANKKQSK